MLRSKTTTDEHGSSRTKRGGRQGNRNVFRSSLFRVLSVTFLGGFSSHPHLEKRPAARELPRSTWGARKETESFSNQMNDRHPSSPPNAGLILLSPEPSRSSRPSCPHPIFLSVFHPYLSVANSLPSSGCRRSGRTETNRLHPSARTAMSPEPKQTTLQSLLF